MMISPFYVGKILIIINFYLGKVKQKGGWLAGGGWQDGLVFNGKIILQRLVVGVCYSRYCRNFLCGESVF